MFILGCIRKCKNKKVMLKLRKSKDELLIFGPTSTNLNSRNIKKIQKMYMKDL